MTRLVGWDTETHLIQPGLLSPPIVCHTFAPSDDRAGLLSAQDGMSYLEELLRDADVALATANGAYDFGCVLAVRPDLLPLVWAKYEAGDVFDVQIAAMLTAIHDGRARDGELYRMDGTRIQSGRYSLDECVQEWLGRKDAKKNDRWRLSYALLADTPIVEWPEDARQYPVDDAVNTLEVAEAQLKRGKNLGNLSAQCHAAFCIHLGAMWGLRTDPARVDAFASEVQSHIDGLSQFVRENKLVRLAGTKKAPKWSKDTAAIKERVFQAYKGQPPTTPTGETSISREALADSGDPVLEKFAEVGKWEKLATYIPTMQEAARVPLNVKPNVLLATGRTSYDGLIQLMPRKGGVRECFKARDGYLLSSVDYAAIEMSTLAQVCLWTVKWSHLADAINEGKDPHCILGADLIGTTYDDFFARKHDLKNIRQAGKAGNFGFPGMMGAPKFVIAQRRATYSVCEWFFGDGKCGAERVIEWRDNPLEMPLCRRCIEQSLVIREKYLQRWEEMRPYWKWVSTEVENRDAVTQFVSERVRGGVNGPQAANTLFQGLAADGAKRAVVALTKEMYLDRSSPLFGSRLLIFSHDETILEVPEDRAHEAAQRQAQVMVEQMRTVVPDVLVKAEPALMRYWYKAAEAVYENGRLVPWEGIRWNPRN